MPIYEYRCESCGLELEKIQKVSDPPVRDCPACGKATLNKLISASAFRLKGSGWYETDFKTGKKKNVLGDTGGEPSTEKKEGASKSESKPSENKPSDSKPSDSKPAGKSGGTTAG